MTFVNGGQRDERHPNRQANRASWEAADRAEGINQDQLDELSGTSGDAWPASAWSPGEAFHRVYTYSKMVGTPDVEDMMMESSTPPMPPAGIYGQRYSDSNDFEPVTDGGYQPPTGMYQKGNSAYSKYTGSDAPSDEDMMFDSLTSQFGQPEAKTPSGVRKRIGTSRYYRYDPSTYPQYDND